MKKVTSLLLLVGVAAFGLVACGDNVVPPEEGNVQGITVTPSTLNIAVGGSGNLSADVDGDPDNSVTWSSNAESVATVDSEGNVTGVSEGNAVVTATSNVDNAHSASAEINVTATEEAEVSIANITNASGGPVDVNNVSGQINVTVNVSEGDQSIETVDLLVDGEVASSQDFASASVVEGAEAQGEVSQLTFNLRTDRAPADAEMDGTPVEGEFQNGERVISAQVTLASGGTNSATNSQTLNFNNEDRVVVTRWMGGQGVVGNGVRYWGGEDMVLAATAVLFSGRGVGTIDIGVTPGAATANGGDPMTPDATSVSEAPYQFPVVAADQGDVEDDAVGSGHTVEVTAMQDADGVNYTVGTDIAHTPLTEFYVDYRSPVVGAAAEITEAGDDITQEVFYNEGEFGVSDLTELGVGGLAMVFDADVISTTEAPDYEDVASFADLLEHGDADNPALPQDVKILVRDVADALGNSSNLDPADGGVAVDAEGGDPAGYEEHNASEYMGVDHTAPEASNELPAGFGSPTFVFNGSGVGGPGGDNEINFDVTDPDLADGNDPSGRDDAAATFEIQDDEGNVLASGSPDMTLTPTYAINPSVAGEDGPQVTIATMADNANDANESEVTFEYILDTTPPSFSALNPSPTSTSTGATSVIQTIGGTVEDANAIADATISIYVDGDAATTTQADAASDGVCDAATDYELSVADGEVDRNNVDISNDTDMIDFEESFEITDPFPAGTGTVKYCYFVEATDEALDMHGDADGNTASVQTNADVEWTNP